MLDRGGNVERHGFDRNADQHDCARRTDDAHRALDRLRRAARVEHDVGAPATGLVLDHIKEIALGDVDRDDPWVSARDVELRLVDVAEENPAASPRKRRQRDHDADRACAEHDRDIARLDARPRRRLHADGEGFDHRALFERDVVGKLEGEGRGVDDRACEAAVDRRRRPEGHFWVDIVDAEPRRLGAEVRHAWLHADAVTDGERMHVGADLASPCPRLRARAPSGSLTMYEPMPPCV